MKAFSDSPDTRIALLQQAIEHINETLVRFEKRFDNIEKIMHENFKEIRKESRTQFWCIITFIIALVGLPIIQNIITHYWSH